MIHYRALLPHLGRLSIRASARPVSGRESAETKCAHSAVIRIAIDWRRRPCACPAENHKKQGVSVRRQRACDTRSKWIHCLVDGLQNGIGQEWLADNRETLRGFIKVTRNY